MRSLGSVSDLVGGRSGYTGFYALEDQPEIKGEMLDIIGYIYYNLGMYDEAQNLIEEAITLRKVVHWPNHLDVAESMATLGVPLLVDMCEVRRRKK